MGASRPTVNVNAGWYHIERFYDRRLTPAAYTGRR